MKKNFFFIKEGTFQPKRWPKCFITEACRHYLCLVSFFEFCLGYFSVVFYLVIFPYTVVTFTAGTLPVISLRSSCIHFPKENVIPILKAAHRNC